MIGRGTRLCKDLFGPGLDKSEFLIFDHWGNFAFHDLNAEEVEPTVPKPLTQRRYEARIELAALALARSDIPAFEALAQQLQQDAVLAEQRKVRHHAHADRDEQQREMGEHEICALGHRFAHRGKVKTGEQQNQADHRARQGQRQAAREHFADRLEHQQPSHAAQAVHRVCSFLRQRADSGAAFRPLHRGCLPHGFPRGGRKVRRSRQLGGGCQPSAMTTCM